MDPLLLAVRTASPPPTAPATKPTIELREISADKPFAVECDPGTRPLTSRTTIAAGPREV